MAGNLIDRPKVRAAARAIRQAAQRVSMRHGRFSQVRPLSLEFGFDRGTPVDRGYIEAFLQANAARIRGRVLEIGDDGYSRRFGGSAITRQDILHVHSGNPMATIVGDLSDPAVLPDAAFDCMILTQTIHLIFDLPAAMRQIHRALRPGGVALITVPGITPIDRDEWGSSWYWSLTPAALQRLLVETFPGGSFDAMNFGNLYAATTFLHGAALEEVNRRKLLPYDPAFPIIVAACAQRGA
jgi:SAM-dependent methyltransferase